MSRIIFTLLFAILTHSAHSLAQEPPANTPPFVTITAPAKTLAVYSNEPVIIRATAFDNEGTVSEVRLLVNGSAVAIDLSSPYEFIFTPATFGNYTLQAEAVDNHGAIALSDARLLQYVRIVDNFSPQLAPAFGTNLTLRASNVNATHQKGEPQHAGVPGGKSVWFAWRPTVTGTVVMDTGGSDFDTVLAVYTNSSTFIPAVTNIIAVAASDNDSEMAPLSRVKFTAFANTIYLIAVDGRDGFAGNIELNIRQVRSLAAPNDFLAFATRTFSTGISTASNVGASKEPGEPDHAGNPGGASLWWRLDDSSTLGMIEISTLGSSFDTVVAVYTNATSRQQLPGVPPMSELRLIASNDDAAGTNRTSEVSIIPRGFVTYWIAVDGYNGAQGNVRLTVSRQSKLTPALNDAFSRATVLLGPSVLTNGNNTLASTEFGEPIQQSGINGGRSVWYRWVAPASGPVYVSTEWSSFDTLLGVYAGTNITGLFSVAFNDDDGGLRTSAVVFNAIEGIEYRITVAGYRGASGDFVLMLNQPKIVLPRMVTQWDGGRIALSIAGSSETLLLESSSDLVEWEPVRLVKPEDEIVELDPSQEIRQQFYRVRSVE